MTFLQPIAERAQNPAYVADLPAADLSAKPHSSVSPCAACSNFRSVAENRAGANMEGSIGSGATFQYGVLIEQHTHDMKSLFISFDDAAHDTLEEALEEANCLSKYSDIRLLSIIRINRETGATDTALDEKHLTYRLDDMRIERERGSL